MTAFYSWTNQQNKCSRGTIWTNKQATDKAAKVTKTCQQGPTFRPTTRAAAPDVQYIPTYPEAPHMNTRWRPAPKGNGHCIVKADKCELT